MALNRRLVFATALLALLLAASVALASWQRVGVGASGAFDVEVVGPDGVLFSGSVRVDEATALSLLQAAAAEGGFELALQEYPGMGTYVRGIGGHHARGAAGWIYEVRVDDKWVSGDRAANHVALEAGQALRWRWVDG